MRQRNEPGRTLVMGIVNVTPDSFSDGGEFASTAEASAEDGRWSPRALT